MNARPMEALYGGFRMAGMHVALPLGAVREVVPLGAAFALPCNAAGLIGAIDLRGALLPVLDLHQSLHGERGQGRAVCVVAHGGSLLGLLIDGVSGLFQARPDSVIDLRSAHADTGLLCGSLTRDDDGALLALLAPEGLFALPGVPVLADPRPQSAATLMHGAPAGARGGGDQVLLVACGGLPMALRAMDVHATVARPLIEASPISHGACLGVMRYAGQAAPVVDLLALCGLGRQDPAIAIQSVLVRVASGLVCLLVERVIDVVDAQAGSALPLAARCLPEPGLFSGMLPDGALPGHLHALAPTGDGHYLLLDGAALRASPRLEALAAALAGTCQADPAQGVFAGAPDATVAPSRPLLVFDLPGRVAAPLEQVVEILPWPEQAMRLVGRSPLLAIALNRGRSLPVLDLAALLGVQGVQPAAGSCLLLVEVQAETVAFAVPRLHGIETADWQSRDGETQADGALAAPAGAFHAAVGGRRRVARLADGQGRLLRVLDLQGLAAIWLGLSGAPPACAPSTGTTRQGDLSVGLPARDLPRPAFAAT